MSVSCFDKNAYFTDAKVDFVSCILHLGKDTCQPGAIFVKYFQHARNNLFPVKETPEKYLKTLTKKK